MGGGPRIVEYDERWPASAETWSRRLIDAFPESAGAGRAECVHVGSTAVPGLAAKPFLDLQVTVDALPAEATLTAAWAPLGLVRARGSRPDSPGVSFDIPRPGSDPRFHEKLLFVGEEPTADAVVEGVIVHVRLRESAFAAFVLSFRDWLRGDHEARAEYEALKRELAEEHASAADYDDYTRAKTAFMDRAQAEMDRKTARRRP